MEFMDFGEFLFWVGVVIISVMAVTIGILFGFLIFEAITGVFKR